MGYYQGDFYAGARGDPFWGQLAAIGGKIASAVHKGGAVMKGMLMPGGGATSSVKRGWEAIKDSPQLINKHPVLSAAGAAGAIGALGTAGVSHMMMPAMTLSGAPKGFHVCKSMQHARHPHPCKTGMFVRNRRMNVCNPRALRRAIRRARGFTKLAMRTIHLVHPKKKGRFGGFKARRKR